MNLLNFLFPFAYIGQGQIAGQQQQTEWDAANQRNNLLNSSLATQTAQQADSWDKLQQEQRMIQMASQAQSNQVPQAVQANGAPPVTPPPDISAQAGMASLAVPPAAAVVPTPQPAPQAPAQPSPQQQIAAQAAGTQPSPAPAQTPPTPAQASVASAGEQPADPKVRAAALAAGQTPPAAAGSTPPIATLAALPLQKFMPVMDDVMEKAKQKLDAEWAVGDLPRATATMQEIMRAGPQLASEVRAQAQLQVDQLKSYKFAADTVATTLGNPGNKTAADFQQQKAILMASPAWNFIPDGQKQMILAANPTDDAVGKTVDTFRNAGMNASQQANDASKQRQQDALAKQRDIQDRLKQFDEDFKVQVEQHKQAQQAINNKAGKVTGIAPKDSISLMDNLLGPAYFGSAEPNPDDTNYQQLRQTLYEGARARQQANRALGFTQAYQMEVNEAKQRGDFTPATTKSVPGVLYGTNQEPVAPKLSLQGMTPDKAISLTPQMAKQPQHFSVGRYYTIPDGPRKGTYQWTGTQMVPAQ